MRKIIQRPYNVEIAEYLAKRQEEIRRAQEADGPKRASGNTPARADGGVPASRPA